jgi:hypothetical protein
VVDGGEGVGMLLVVVVVGGLFEVECLRRDEGFRSTMGIVVDLWC